MASRTRRLDIEITDSRKGHGFRDAGRDVDAFDRKIKRGSSAWSSALSGFGNVATAALGAAAVGLTAVGVAAFSAVKAAEESRKVTRQTTAVLESMGNVAGITADEVAELSEQLSLKTGIDDELIQSGQNVLLTFGRVRDEVGKGNDIFTRATTAALDMSVALGQDMQSSVTQLGKALNDPIAGISALSRVGVQFTADQKEMITMLVVGGDVLGAQKVILAELEAQFTGSAEAQATASDKMAVAFGNVQEALGEKLLPWFERFSDWVISDGIPRATEMFDTFEQKLIPKFREAASTVGGMMVPMLKLLGATWLRVTEQMKPLLESLGKLLSAITGNKDKASDLQQGLKVLGIVFAAAFGPPIAFAAALVFVAQQIRVVVSAITFVINKIREFLGLLGSIPGRVRDSFQNILGGGGGIVGQIGGALSGLFGAQGGIVTSSGIERFAGGGIAGLARGRDNVPSMLSRREMVLTERDQRNLLGMIGSGRGGGATYVTEQHFHIAGSVLTERGLVAALNRAGSKGIKLNPGVIG